MGVVPPSSSPRQLDILHQLTERWIERTCANRATLRICSISYIDLPVKLWTLLRDPEVRLHRGASRTSRELRCWRLPRSDRRASWFARSSRRTRSDAKNSTMMAMGIVPTDGAWRTTTPVVAVLRCITAPRASAQKADMQRLVVHVETGQNDAVPQANQPLTSV